MWHFKEEREKRRKKREKEGTKKEKKRRRRGRGREEKDWEMWSIFCQVEIYITEVVFSLSFLFAVLVAGRSKMQISSMDCIIYMESTTLPFQRLVVRTINPVPHMFRFRSSDTN